MIPAKCLACHQEIKFQRKFCSENCKKIHSNNLANQRWVSKEYKEPIPRAITHPNFNRSHCSKRECEGWMTKFKAIRG